LLVEPKLLLPPDRRVLRCRVVALIALLELLIGGGITEATAEEDQPQKRECAFHKRYVMRHECASASRNDRDDAGVS
jgi:hypothetical protein